jgi:pilus assembly protein CpaC
MKPLALLAAAVLTLAVQHPTRAHAAAEVVASAETELKLEAGKGRLIRLSRPAATVFIANPAVADVQVKSPTLVYVMGKGPGSTSLFAMDKQEQMIANLAVVVGVDESRLIQLIRQEAPRSQVQVASAGDSLILSGNVSSAAEGEDVLRIATLFLVGDARERAGRIINRLTVDAPNQINLRVRIAEVSRDASKQLGFNWESLVQIGQGGGFLGWATGADIINDEGKLVRPSGASTGIVGGIVNPLTGKDINLLIDALATKNLVSILAEPNLTAVSGEPASFLAGGEFPVPVPQGLNQTTVQFKQFGVSLSFVATILDGGRISLNVRPEVSQLASTGSIVIGGITIPALTTRRAETTVDLASGQSFAIAGLLQNNVTRELSKLPGAGDVPILGQLFRSQRFQRSESELVIIVTPYLVKPVNHRLATPLDHEMTAGTSPVAARPAAAAEAADKTEPKG